MKNRNNKGQFIVGHVEDPETKIKRINSCKKAWRKRKDYKGHTKNNVVPCCLECNTARNNNFSFEEMKILGKTIGEIKNSRK